MEPVTIRKAVETLVHIQSSQVKDMACGKCSKRVTFGQHYTVRVVYPKPPKSVRYHRKHYPNCELPAYGFGAGGMGKSYIVIS